MSRSRIIRSIAGLRPFRPSGFVVNAERMNDKVIIHNYGHGGGGITLSWGTSHLAMELANETEFKRCAILGCGAAGLSAARLMQTAGWESPFTQRIYPIQRQMSLEVNGHQRLFLRNSLQRRNSSSNLRHASRLPLLPGSVGRNTAFAG